MPSREQHLVQAARNEAASRTLAENGYPDWAAVALFYAALHLVDAYLACFQHLTITI